MKIETLTVYGKWFECAFKSFKEVKERYPYEIKDKVYNENGIRIFLTSKDFDNKEIVSFVNIFTAID